MSIGVLHNRQEASRVVVPFARHMVQGKFHNVLYSFIRPHCGVTPNDRKVVIQRHFNSLAHSLHVSPSHHYQQYKLKLVWH